MGEIKGDRREDNKIAVMLGRGGVHRRDQGPPPRRALHGLYLAWSQRLVFTVGTSLTTGRPNCVTWNDIHLKTAVSGGEHSYPDPAFLTNLMAELAGFGITEGEVGAHMTAHPALRTTGGL